MKNCLNKGFSLIELLITIAILGILTAISYPTYHHLMRKAYYTEIAQATAPFKLGVEECYQITSTLDDCNSGKNGIPKNITKKENENSKSLVASLTVSGKGVITVTPKERDGITSSDIYILTPTSQNNRLTWSTGGKGIENGYAK